MCLEICSITTRVQQYALKPAISAVNMGLIRTPWFEEAEFETPKNFLMTTQSQFKEGQCILIVAYNVSFSRSLKLLIHSNWSMAPVGLTNTSSSNNLFSSGGLTAGWQLMAEMKMKIAIKIHVFWVWRHVTQLVHVGIWYLDWLLPSSKWIYTKIQ